MDQPLAISMGEPAGIGPDLILQLFNRREELELPAFCVFGHEQFLAERARRLGLEITVRRVNFQETLAVFADALPVVAIEGVVPDSPGQPSALAGKVVINAIEQAVAAVMCGVCRGLVTAPIHKAALYDAGFVHPGHTEFLAALCTIDGRAKLPVMMLAHGGLRTVPVTIHIPIAEVAKALNQALILDTLRVVHHDLKTRFGIAVPRIGVAGLNPHAGEAGNIGLEEVEMIGPAVAQAQFEAINAEGPFPADTLFYPPHWQQYDAVVAMYHDQALIPIKTVAFEDAVNVTLGLPIVRTSPDHGTAFDLAGTGAGSSKSMLAAIRLADAMTRGQPA